MRILVAAESTPTALALARLLADTGHTVFGAHAETIWGTSPARYSRAYAKFFQIRREKTSWSWAGLLEEIGRVELVIPCGIEGADIAKEVKKLNKGKDKSIKVIWHRVFDTAAMFQDFVRECILRSAAPRSHSERPSESDFDDLVDVVRLPKAFEVSSYRDLHAILVHFPDTQFELSRTPYDDDEDTLVELSCDHGIYHPAERTALRVSRHAIHEGETARAIADLGISPTHTYRLTEVMLGITYEAHSFLNSGMVQTFVVTTPAPNTEDSFIIVPPTELIVAVLQVFMEKFVHKWQMYRGQKGVDVDIFGDDKPKASTGNLSVKFIVQEGIRNGEVVKSVTVLSLSNHLHASLPLLATNPASKAQLVRAYIAPSSNELLPVLTPAQIPFPRGTYKIHDVLTEVWNTLCVFRPFAKGSWRMVAQMCMMLFVWGCYFEEEMWCTADPGPAIVEWVVRRPAETVMRIRAVQGLWRFCRGLWQKMKEPEIWLLGRVKTKPMAKTWVAS